MNQDSTPVTYCLYEWSPAPLFLAYRGTSLVYSGFVLRDYDPADRMKSISAFRSRQIICRTDSPPALRDAFLADWRGGRLTIPHLLSGTPFQIDVWQALLTIPFGKTVSYREIAHAVGRPHAARAVGQAVGANPLSLVIPCHRVVPLSGGAGQYAWGEHIKKQLLQKEKVAISGEKTAM